MLWFLYQSLRILVNNAWYASQSLLVRSREITALVCEVAQAPDASNVELREIFLKKKRMGYLSLQSEGLHEQDHKCGTQFFDRGALKM